jgi:hypothetical protein
VTDVMAAAGTCLSCFSKFFSGNYPFAYDLGELSRYWRGYAHLMDHWRDVLPAGAILAVDHHRKNSFRQMTRE